MTNFYHEYSEKNKHVTKPQVLASSITCLLERKQEERQLRRKWGWRGKNHKTGATRENQSLFFFFIGLVEMATAFRSLWMVRHGSALDPDKTRKVTDYITFTNVTTVKDDLILIQLWAVHTFSPLF